jgi:hypothetical protein
MSSESDFVRATVFANMITAYAMRLSPEHFARVAYLWAGQHAQMASAWYEQAFETDGSHVPAQRYVPRARPGERPTVEQIKYEAEENARQAEEDAELASEAEENGEDPVLAKFRREMNAQGRRVVGKGE